MRLFKLILFLSLFLTGVPAVAGSPVKTLLKEKKDTLSRVDSIINIVRMIGESDKATAPDSIVQDKSEVALGALEYVSSVYEDVDYYASGYWGDARVDVVPTVIYTDTLPKYVSKQFRDPAIGMITSPFGLRSDGGKMHRGIDIALHQGDSVCVALDGTVERIGYERNGYGHFVIVSHADGVQTRYAHLQRPIVTSGAKVKAGDRIGLGGSTGNSTGPHLHFEMRCRGMVVDPTFMFRREMTR